MEPTRESGLTDGRGSLRLVQSRTTQLDHEPFMHDTDPREDEMSLQDQILASWYLAGATESGLGAPSELDFWRYAA